MAATLPPNWSRYQTDEGKEYFHNSSTNATQWERPEWPASEGGSGFDPGSTSEVYQYKPSDLELTQQTVKQDTPASDFSPGAGGTENYSMSPSAGADGSLGGVNLSGTISPMPGMEGKAMPATSHVTASNAEGEAAPGGWILGYLQQQFDVTTDDVVMRLKLALLPLPKAEGDNTFRNHPDFWGPFWVATTAVLFLAATANMALYLHKGGIHFLGDYSLVSVGAAMIYGCLIAVPSITRLAMYLSGREADSMDLRQMICVYGYSLTSIIPVSLVCIFPSDLVQWLAVMAGLGISLLFMFRHLWSDLQQETPTMKIVIIGTIAAAQVIIFSVYKLYFLHVS